MSRPESDLAAGFDSVARQYQGAREIRARLARRPDGRLRRGWGAVLHVARRRETPV